MVASNDSPFYASVTEEVIKEGKKKSYSMVNRDSETGIILQDTEKNYC